MTANDGTPRNGESVSDGSHVEHEAILHDFLEWQLRDTSGELRGKTGELVSEARRGELSRDTYQEARSLHMELGELLTYVDELTSPVSESEGGE